jgi:hypothetical protein
MYRLPQGVFHPLDGQADHTLADTVFRRDTVHRPVLPQVFQDNTQFVSDRQFWRGLPPFCVKHRMRFVESTSFFQNVADFTPYNRLKRTVLASVAFSPFSHAVIIVSLWLLNKSNKKYPNYFLNSTSPFT